MELENYFQDSKFVNELSPSDFHEVNSYLLTNHKCSIVMFYAPWCKFCKNMRETWENLGKVAVFFDVCALNCEKYFSHKSKIDYELPGLLNGFPSIIIYEKGVPKESVENGNDLEYYIKVCMRSCKNAN